MSTSAPSSTTEPTQNSIAPAVRARLLADLPVIERTLPVRDVATAVLEGGDGPPLVLIHGPGESALWWLRVIPDLVASHQIVVPDLPGHGASRAADTVLDPEGVVGWLEELIDRTCASPPVLVGHLLGGAIAARCAAARRTNIRQLVLVDSFGLGWLVPAPRFALDLIRFMMRPSEHTYGRFLKQCLYDPDDLREEMGDRWEPFLAYNLELADDPENRAALGALMRNVGVPRIPPEELERIDVPTSLIWGRHDRANPLRKAEAASERYGWPLHVIEHARDDPKLERPDAFLRALYAMLRSSDGGE